MLLFLDVCLCVVLYPGNQGWVESYDGMMASFADYDVPIGLSLEKMDELFGVSQLLEHKNADEERASIGDGVDKSSQVHVEKVN